MPRQRWSELLWWETADGTAIANTTTETIIFPDKTIPANLLADGKVLSLYAWGKFSTTTGPPTLRFRLRWGGVAGTVLADSGTITTIASVTNAMFGIFLQLICRVNGSSGALLVMGQATLYGAVAPTVGSATGAPAIAAMGSAGITAPAAVGSLDLTANAALSLSAAWSAASASNTLTGMKYYCRDEQ